MKKSFTLIEVLVSIALLSIIVIFLYKALDTSTKSNQFFSNKLLLQEEKSNLKKMFFKDISQSDANSTKNIIEDKNKNAILKLKTINTYHNSFFNNITYFISNKHNLIRIESRKVFNKHKLFDDFFDEAYVDIVSSNIYKFKVIKKTKKTYAIYLQFKDKSDMMFVFNVMR